MKADPRPVKPAAADEGILSTFDPVVEGASFQIIEEGLDPQSFSAFTGAAEALDTPEVLATFDLGDSLARVPDKLFFRIGEVAELLDVKTYVLRFWETEFPMVSPQKSRSGQRVYRKKDVEMLLLIKHLLYVERFSIEGARKRIRELKQKSGAGKSPAAAVAASVAKPGAAPAPAEASARGAVFAADRESLKSALAELEKLAKPELSRFFRF
jgi:DNA-binding transcriptional MerR regulator